MFFPLTLPPCYFFSTREKQNQTPQTFIDEKHNHDIPVKVENNTPYLAKIYLP